MLLDLLPRALAKRRSRTGFLLDLPPAAARFSAPLPPVIAPADFPTQYAGLRVRKTGSTIDLCLVAEADAPAGMGGVLKISKSGTTYAVYLVDTSDANASPVQIKTTTAIKAIRLKT